jgi:2-hydroxychromene-2-carboxylate isomerase
MPLPAKRPKALRCYFSLRSPYSWLALRDLDRRGLHVGTQLDYVPYFEPAGPLKDRLIEVGGRILYVPMSREKHRYILGDVKRIMKRKGIEPVWPIDDSPDWSIPHLIYLACPTPQLARNFIFAAMEARWLAGADIWRWEWARERLDSLAGADAAQRVVAAAQGVEVAERAVSALVQAYRDDVFGVPFFVAGRERFWGADRLDAFLEASGTA